MILLADQVHVSTALLTSATGQASIPKIGSQRQQSNPARDFGLRWFPCAKFNVSNLALYLILPTAFFKIAIAR